MQHGHICIYLFSSTCIYTYLLLLISMLWHRQAIHLKSKQYPVFSQYVKVGGDLLKVGGDSSSAKRCGAATPRRGGHGRGFPPPIGGGPGNFCKNGSQIQQSGAF